MRLSAKGTLSTPVDPQSLPFDPPLDPPPHVIADDGIDRLLEFPANQPAAYYQRIFPDSALGGDVDSWIADMRRQWTHIGATVAPEIGPYSPLTYASDILGYLELLERHRQQDVPDADACAMLFARAVQLHEEAFWRFNRGAPVREAMRRKHAGRVRGLEGGRERAAAQRKALRRVKAAALDLRKQHPQTRVCNRTWLAHKVSEKLRNDPEAPLLRNPNTIRKDLRLLGIN